MSKPVFVHPISKQEIAIPDQVLDGDKPLNFLSVKADGWACGGWYEDEDHNRFMVKFYDKAESCYAEKLINDLARISVGADFVAATTSIGTAEFRGKTQPCFISQQVPNYRDIKDVKVKDAAGKVDEIASVEARKSYGIKFHRSHAFNSLVAYDDLNEENIGLSLSESGEENSVIVDYGMIPPILFPEQVETAKTPLSLASLMGHRNPKGLQLVRRRYFGYGDYLTPFDRIRNPEEQAHNPEDISYFEVLNGIRKIVDNKEEIFATIQESLDSARLSTSLTEEEKDRFNQKFTRFENILQKRISWMEENFAEDLVNLTEKSEEFKSQKWRSKEKFFELMKAELAASEEQAKTASIEDLQDISTLIQKDPSEVLSFDCATLSTEDREKLSKLCNEKFVLHNAAMAGNKELADWLLKNDLVDINKPRLFKNHNYHTYRLTPLHAAISTYHDNLYYDTAHSAQSHEMIDILKAKFLEKNGEQFDESKCAIGSDKFAVTLTFCGLEEYQKRKDQVEDKAATKIQSVIRGHSARNLNKKQIHWK
jgi:hypothetical protein